MNYSIIVVGDELLIGQVVDTNSGWIARHMLPLGWTAHSVKVVADSAESITQAIDEAFAHTDVVLMTGGLGPTKDDITKSTLCHYFGGELVYNQATATNVAEVMQKRGLELNDYTRSQAMVPSSCRVIQNEVGTAPLMWYESNGKVLVSMPGVPHEMSTMLQREVAPQLIAHFKTDMSIMHRTFVVVDVIESALSMKLNDFENNLPAHLHLAYLPQPGIVRLRLTGMLPNRSQLEQDIEQQSARLHNILGDAIWCDEDKTIAQIVGDLLKKHQLTMSTAESCTGGNIAHVITEIAGSSQYFLGSVVSYANAVKESVLHVSPTTIVAHGVVSEPVVEQMVTGVCQALGTDCAVATSGIAGPGGAVPGKPVGTVWMAAKCNDKVTTQCLHLPGDRSRVINRATVEALKMLCKMLRELQ